MTVALCTLALNEIEWLPKLWDQHKDWPNLIRWVFIEGADEMYTAANPDMVTEKGLSVDGTTEWLSQLADTQKNVRYIQHGRQAQKTNLAQGKCELRDMYLKELEHIRPDFFITLDADEFYTKRDQERIEPLMIGSKHSASIFKRREVWRPPSVVHQPLFSQEVTGGFWDIPCCHWWRWQPGLCFKSNHNTPETKRGESLGRRFERFDMLPDAPQMYHLGFAASVKTRTAKNRYYEMRGEAVDVKRKWYCESRMAFEVWQPGDSLPHGAKVITWQGSIPECFKEMP
jgi:hypothetical protein